MTLLGVPHSGESHAPDAGLPRSLSKQWNLAASTNLSDYFPQPMMPPMPGTTQQLASPYRSGALISPKNIIQTP